MKTSFKNMSTAPAVANLSNDFVRTKARTLPKSDYRTFYKLSSSDPDCKVGFKISKIDEKAEFFIDHQSPWQVASYKDIELRRSLVNYIELFPSENAPVIYNEEQIKSLKLDKLCAEFGYRNGNLNSFDIYLHENHSYIFLKIESDLKTPKEQVFNKIRAFCLSNNIPFRLAKSLESTLPSNFYISKISQPLKIYVSFNGGEDEPGLQEINALIEASLKDQLQGLPYRTFTRAKPYLDDNNNVILEKKNMALMGLYVLGKCDYVIFAPNSAASWDSLIEYLFARSYLGDKFIIKCPNNDALDDLDKTITP